MTTGIFVAVGFFLFGLIVYSLSGDESVFSNRSRVHSYFEDTQGLMFGSVVSFSGITIGNVKEINYDSNRKALRVDFTVKKSFLPFIKTDSKAELKTQGALGDRYIFIGTGSSEAPSIKAGEEILSEKSGDIFKTVQEKINSIPDLAGLSKKIEALLDFLNSEEGLKGSTRELKNVLGEVKSTLGQVNNDQNIKSSLKKLDSVMSKIESGQGTLGRLVNDPGLYNKINSFLTKSDDSSHYLKNMARKSIESSENIKK